MPQRPPRQVRFVTATLEHLPDDRCRARVIFQRPGHDLYVGTVERPEADGDGLACVAEAAAQALRQAVPPQDASALQVQGVHRFDCFGREGILVAVAARRNVESRQLTGVSTVNGDPAWAAALAVLHATNRFLGTG